MNHNNRLRESVERRIDEIADPNAIRVYSYRFPHPAFALRGPAIDSLCEPAAVLQRLDTAFPTVGAYSPWANILSLPGGA